jgi:hypothetical protein
VQNCTLRRPIEVYSLLFAKSVARILNDASLVVFAPHIQCAQLAAYLEVRRLFFPNHATCSLAYWDAVETGLFPILVRSGWMSKNGRHSSFGNGCYPRQKRAEQAIPSAARGSRRPLPRSCTNRAGLDFYGSLLKASSAWANPLDDTPIAKSRPAASFHVIRPFPDCVFQRCRTSSFNTTSAKQPPGRHLRQPRSRGSESLASGEKLGEFGKATLTGRTTVSSSGSDFFKRPIATSANGFCWSCARICWATSQTCSVSAPLPRRWQRSTQSPKLADVLVGVASTIVREASGLGVVNGPEDLGASAHRHLSATRLSLSFLRFCHGNAGENVVASRSWAKCLLENHHLHG